MKVEGSDEEVMPLVTATTIEYLFVALNRPLLLLTDLSITIADELSTILMSLGCTQKDVKVVLLTETWKKLAIKKFFDSLNKNFLSRHFHFDFWPKKGSSFLCCNA